MTADFRKIPLLLLAANFLFGLAIIAILPPFEGFDETAHFSRLKSQAFFPQAGSLSQHIAKDVFDYYRQAPMPYGWIDFAPLHADDSLGGYTTYHDFFTQPSRVAAYSESYWQSPLSAEFSASPEPNWQYQHPAFYYIVTAQVMKLLAGHVSLITAMLILRLFSFLLAFAGFCIGLHATWVHLRASGTIDAHVITAFGALYPFLTPMFFWEFARLGNDSMCLFLFGIVWALVLWQLRDPRGEAWAYLGFCLGLSWLTKTLMIPVSLGIVAFLAWHHTARLRKDTRHAKNYWQAPLKIAALMLLIGAPLYLASYFSAGAYGSNEFTRAMKGGDFWLRLQDAWAAKGFSGLDPRQILYTFVLGFVSWSQTILDMPFFFYSFMCDFFVAVSLIYLVILRRREEELFRLPLWTVGPMLLGLLVHVAVVMVLPGNLSTPGYYLHVLAPAFALIYGVGLTWMFGKKWLKAATGLFITVAVLLDFCIVWSFATLFSGCVVPFQKYSGKDFLWFHPADVVHCTGQFSQVMGSLGVLAWPRLALGCLALAFACLAVSGFRSLRIKP